MPIDPVVQALLDQGAEAGTPPIHELPLDEARALMSEFLPLQGEPEDVARTEDRVIPGPAGEIPLRLYWPSGEGPHPGLVYFHGGGWVIGNIDSHDPLCRLLTNAAGCVTVSVDYRLAPEHKYPAAAEDCYAATRWVAEQATELGVDSSRIAVAGDSAGGNLAAVVSLMARERRGPALVAQVMHCPVTDHDLDTASYIANADGYMLERASMRWFWDHYLSRPEDGAEPYASPLRAEDLSGLPPALVQVAGFDPLHDEGVAYARRLEEAGVPTTLTDYDDVIHDPFMFFGVLSQGRRAVDEAVAHLRRAFGG